MYPYPGCADSLVLECWLQLRTLWSITNDIGVLPVCECVPSTTRCKPHMHSSAQHSTSEHRQCITTASVLPGKWTA